MPQLVEFREDVDRRNGLIYSSAECPIRNDLVRSMDFGYSILDCYFLASIALPFLMVEYVKDALFKVSVVLIIHFDYLSACAFIESSHFWSQGVEISNYHLWLVFDSVPFVREGIVQSVGASICANNQGRLLIQSH